MEDLERLFKGLADQTRLRILNLLLHGELCVCDIQYVLASPQPNVSRHLLYLKHAGLVTDRREGARMYYQLAQPAKRLHRTLFAFLRHAFATCPELAQDSRRLRKAIQSGSCTAGAWHPFSAMEAHSVAREPKDRKTAWQLS
ncbi:MAG: metalloregulator ArsR/SmtB family transcription factor [Acidobacteriia bacterium]|nr:metalloregulator ArsR/SmtB family transcription factor [Terriglobia bacterium]